MPSANFIQKEILHALEDQIIPALWQPGLALGCVVPPLDFPGDIHARLLQKSVPRKDTSGVYFSLQSRWAEENLQSSHYPYFGFIYEGTADERTLITEEQAAKYNIAQGIYAIRWQAPSVVFFPPGVPHNDGNAAFWESDQSAQPIKILWINIGSEVSVHTYTNNGKGQRHCSHSLQIDDPSVNVLTQPFLKEIQNGRSDNQNSVQAILLSMMLCLRNDLREGHAKIANTSYSVVPIAMMPPDESAGEACRDAAIYIESHLHESLSVSVIAAKVNLSSGHLNRLFRRLYNISVMHYVRSQRIAAAKGMLEKCPENIAEIAQLVGFKRANLFCKAFRIETGLTPGQYRRKIKRDKSTFSTPNVPIEE